MRYNNREGAVGCVCPILRYNLRGFTENIIKRQARSHQLGHLLLIICLRSTTRISLVNQTAFFLLYSDGGKKIVIQGARCETMASNLIVNVSIHLLSKD